jgi:F-type H+-transporting ATPase subunit a
MAQPGFVPPDSNDFIFKPIFGSSIFMTKPALMIFFSVILIVVFFTISARKAAVVPSRLQFAGESVYGFVRTTIGQDVIGPEFERFTPFLFAIFTFVLTNNLFGVIPFMQFPTMSRIGFPVSITIFVYLVYHYVAIKKKGLGRYLKEMCFMPGVPKPIYIILAPVEFLTYFAVRPLTLAMRLFGNMFAGHLLLLLFTLGGEYMLKSALFVKFFSVLSFGMAIGLSFFEMGIECLQAYIFTLLAALYIAGALADEH